MNMSTEYYTVLDSCLATLHVSGPKGACFYFFVPSGILLSWIQKRARTIQHRTFSRPDQTVNKPSAQLIGGYYCRLSKGLLDYGHHHSGTDFQLYTEVSSKK